MSSVLVQRTLEIPTPGRGLFDITREISDVVSGSAADVGLCSVFVQHTSASLLIQENADPAVLRDVIRWLDHVAPENAGYEHDDEGPDDMPAHLRGTITRTGEMIPVCRGRLLLGNWQAIYLCEHRRRPHRRRIVVTVLGDRSSAPRARRDRSRRDSRGGEYRAYQRADRDREHVERRRPRGRGPKAPLVGYAVRTGRGYPVGGPGPREPSEPK